MQKFNGVVITGLGLLTSIGNKDETWSNLINCGLE